MAIINLLLFLGIIHGNHILFTCLLFFILNGCLMESKEGIQPTFLFPSNYALYYFDSS